MNTNSQILEFKRRMLVWGNPVEYVNNMYGSHPDDNDKQRKYFDIIYEKGA